MVLRLLLLAGLVLALMWWFGKGRRRQAPPARPATASTHPPPMIRCAHCGVHLPRPEALDDEAGQAFCSDAHRQLGPAPRA